VDVWQNVADGAIKSSLDDDDDDLHYQQQQQQRLGIT